MVIIAQEEWERRVHNSQRTADHVKSHGYMPFPHTRVEPDVGGDDWRPQHADHLGVCVVVAGKLKNKYATLSVIICYQYLLNPICSPSLPNLSKDRPSSGCTLQ
jgi:hypothetical protein